MGLAGRLREYGVLAERLGAYALIGLIWFEAARVFLRNMAPRLAHLSPLGMRIADRPCGSPECDFSAFWPAGLLVRLHREADIYQTAAFLGFRHLVFSPAAELVRWFYPPPALLPSALISFLPFETGFIVWSLAFSAAAIWLWRAAGLPWSVIAVASLSPAALWNLELGQFGTVMAGCLAGGLLLAQTRPFRSGLTLGMLIFKPQYGLLLPVVLLADRNWRGIAGCGLVVAASLALTTLVCGWQIWRDYFTDGLPASRLVLDAGPDGLYYEKFGVCVFWMLRRLGAGLGVSHAAQDVVTILAAAAAWAVWRSRRPAPVERMALTVFLSLLATPYGYTDDMVAWSVALAALAQRRGWRIGLLDALFWLWPALCPVIVMQTGLLLTPLVILLAAGRTWVRCGMAGRQGGAPANPAALAAAGR
jgi:uncharacterized membrane protein (UPF0136 family)